MPQVLSQDLRERVVAAVDGGMSCRGAAERFGVSAASAIRWRQLALRHGTPAAMRQGGNRRKARIEDHAAFILEAIQRQPDPTLAELRIMLAERGVSVSIATLWRFFTRHGITRKKDRPRDGAGSSRRPEASRGLVRWTTRSQSRQAGVYQRNLGIHQHGAALWTLPARTAVARRYPLWSLDVDRRRNGTPSYFVVTY